MDQKQSNSYALALLAAMSADDVEKIIKGNEDARYWFEDPQNWISYGGRAKNWDTVGNQQTNPVGALVELVTNGIDAILLRKARESGIEDFRSAKAPQSMFEAVRRFFPGISITNGRFGHYDTTQNRGITPREAALLQTFPEGYVFFPEDNIHLTATLIGNAVPPKLAKFFGAFIAQRIVGK